MHLYLSSFLIWVNGGNVFLLRRAMQQSGLDNVIIERKSDDGFVYSGYSAGACVVGPTLRGAHGDQLTRS